MVVGVGSCTSPALAIIRLQWDLLSAHSTSTRRRRAPEGDRQHISKAPPSQQSLILTAAPSFHEATAPRPLRCDLVSAIHVLASPQRLKWRSSAPSRQDPSDDIAILEIMADLELRAPAREPTFVKPIDTASHRRSRVSHDSAAASTRSWVLM
ncbi:hypothetical protein DFH09DRAFT_1192227, partial [Mycena vulgaris]